MKFLACSQELPVEMVPPELRPAKAFLCATVLPMGWVNSVGIAQSVRRNVVRQCLKSMVNPITGEAELRRDKTFSRAPRLFRVYWTILMNFAKLIAPRLI